jgi:hypothetical protein
MSHQPKYVPARTNDGWSVAALVVTLAVALIVSVAYIHNRTYKHPTDPTFVSSGDRAGEH